MMRIKKIVPLLIALCMCGGVMAGCDGKKDDSSSNPPPAVNPTPGTGDKDESGKPGEDNKEPEGEKPNEGNNGEGEKPGEDNKEPEGEKPGEVPTETSVPLNEANKIYVVGDSTVCSFSDTLYLPRYGYGTQLAAYLNVKKTQVVNKAYSGRSSLDFITTTNYSDVVNNIGAGDYLIIGFGHNDEKDDDADRYTNPTKSYTDSSTTDGPSFQYTLYENYVKMAKDKGATPILCTPIVRYSSSGDYSGTKAHVTAKGDYAQAIRTLGEATGTTVIDLTEITKAIYSADNTAAQYYHAHSSYIGEKPNETPSGRDDTHINMYGAKMVAYNFAQALLQTDCPLKEQVYSLKTAPTYEVDYKLAVESAEYTKPNYTPIDLSKIAVRKVTGNWYRTVVGNIGGKKASNYHFSYKDGVYHIDNCEEKDGALAASDNGKIDATAGDGFGAIFMQLDKAQNFTISADVKINFITGKNANQAAFGIMLRDELYIDGMASDYTGKETVNSNYVAAGAFMDGSDAVFGRKDTTLLKGSDSVTINTEKTYTMTLTRTGQSIVATFSDGEKTIASGSDFLDLNLFAVDSDYIYLCLFANRGCSVDFSNVVYVDNGLADTLA